MLVQQQTHDCGRLHLPFALTLVALISTVSAAVAEPPSAPGSAESEAQARLEYLQSRWRNVQVRSLKSPDVAYRFHEAPLIRWQNPISGADGAVFMWTSAGRPMILCKCHVNDKKRHYVSSSVSIATELFQMKLAEQVKWAPNEVGIAPFTVKDVVAPADKDSTRLVQMRSIARRYRLQSVWGEDPSGDWELRFLPTPLFRYTSEPAGVIDGALFGFAQGTNPEAVVLVEAVRTSEGMEWRSAASRITGYAVKGWFDDQTVLNVPKINTPDPTGTYHHVYEKPSPYPFPTTTE
jgi:hypothetical protein